MTTTKIELPTVRTPISEVQREAQYHARERLKRVDVRFVRLRCPAALPLAEAYAEAHDRFVHDVEVGLGFVWDPDHFRAACEALDALLDAVPVEHGGRLESSERWRVVRSYPKGEVHSEHPSREYAVAALVTGVGDGQQLSHVERIK